MLLFWRLGSESHGHSKSLILLSLSSPRSIAYPYFVAHTKCLGNRFHFGGFFDHLLWAPWLDVYRHTVTCFLDTPRSNCKNRRRDPALRTLELLPRLNRHTCETPAALLPGSLMLQGLNHQRQSRRGTTARIVKVVPRVADCPVIQNRNQCTGIYVFPDEIFG
jgi:hypothetical protein